MKWVEEKACLRAEVAVKCADDGKSGADKKCGRAARLERGKIQHDSRRARGLGRMMSHAFFGGGGNLTLAVSALAVTVSEATFQTSLIAATRCPQLR